MQAQGFKNGVQVCAFEKDVVPIDQNGYDIDTLRIDGVDHDVTPPEPDPGPPLTDVERLAQGVALYRAANEAAKEIILTLMVKVSGAMINLGVVNAASELITADNVNDEGARFVAYHREAIVDYKQAGRNQVAANALYAAVSSEGSLTAFPWLEASGGIILGIFASELGVTP